MKSTLKDHESRPSPVALYDYDPLDLAMPEASLLVDSPAKRAKEI